MHTIAKLIIIQFTIQSNYNIILIVNNSYESAVQFMQEKQSIANYWKELCMQTTSPTFPDVTNN